jgi:hypothetical protein
MQRDEIDEQVGSTGELRPQTLEGDLHIGEQEGAISVQDEKLMAPGLSILV